MTLARDGWREMFASTVTLGGAAAACAWAATHGSPLWFIPAIVAGGTWLFTIAFFRIPSRAVPAEGGILVAPADGRITEVSRLDAHEGLTGPAIKISIFLSVFDVHVNASPCDGKVLGVTYKPGEFLDARHPECGIRNESNTLVLQPESGRGPIIVRQIAGLIARRIVCNAKSGDRLARGELFGLIKFGSRTDLIVPDTGELEAAVTVGQHVKGRETILLRPARVQSGGSKSSATSSGNRVMESVSA
ncbi:MAG: phosphatidylserine decarboxylase family protein [Planctomycetes bacterium]|nr:phosphatidylserine decarboxylase family protein [Planctomycetota bacterium]